MRKEIVYTDRYALILDTEKDIEENAFTLKDGKIREVSYLGQDNGDAIIAHLPLLDAPMLEGVPLLPPFTERVCNCGLKESEHHVRHPFVPQAEDVEELAKLAFPYLGSEDLISEQNKHTDTLRCGFKEGYRAAKEKYRYTEEEVIKIVEKSRETGLTAEYLMLSLQQPSRPTHFESWMQRIECPDNRQGCLVAHYSSKTTNSQGQEELIGKYL